MPEMASHCPAWAALVKHWDELTTDHKAGVNVYKRMQSILAAPEKADPNLIRLGPGISMRFGS